MNSFRVTTGQQLARISARHDGTRDVVQFDPKRYHVGQATLDYRIEEAKKIQEWPKLEEAVDIKIDEQIKFVAWWHANVRKAGQPRKELTGTAVNSLSVAQAEKLTGMKQQRVSELGKRLQDVEAYRNHLLGAMYFAAYLKIPPPRGTFGTGENEWFTPEFYIALAREVLGEIDLDPATHAQAQRVIKATEFYTKKTDGLKHDWHGRVWLNPPYAQPLIELFVSRMVSEYISGHVTAGIMLTHNYTDTTWFHQAVSAATAVCFTRGRVRFHKPDGTLAQPTQGQAFFYFGPSMQTFISVFSEVGFIFKGDEHLQRQPDAPHPRVLADVIEQLPRVRADVAAAEGRARRGAAA
jgi:phage N-6-adenine-methyltransferase